jgi:CO/xanthine dehydrogenase Mo-binding subunit
VAGASAVANAIEDALADRGVIVRELPITPARLYALLRGR